MSTIEFVHSFIHTLLQCFVYCNITYILSKNKVLTYGRYIIGRSL